MIPALDAVAKIVAERMPNAVIASLALTILAWGLLRLLVRANAGTRAAVWLSVLIGVPGLSVAAVSIGGGSVARQARLIPIVIPETWALAILLAWFVVAAAGLLRLAMGLWRIRKLRNASTPIDVSRLDSSAAEIITRLGCHRRVSLLVSDTVPVPMAMGFLRPAVILPQWALRELSSAKLAAVLLHELAHLCRYDDWINLFQKILRALFFFHPALWWLDRRLALERELACDDAVLTATHNAQAYARCLLEVAEKSLLRRSLALAQAAVQGVRQISLRISQIMDSRRPRSTRVSRAALATVVALTGLCLVALVRSPTLVGFQASPTHPTAVSSLASVAPAAGAAAAFTRRPVQPTMRSTTRALGGSTLTAARFKQRSHPHIVAEKFMPRHERQQLLSAAESSPASPMPVESVWLVMRNAGTDSTGHVVWTIKVWRVTMFLAGESGLRLRAI
ncbi:MAG: M56 family metallopeptidase [Acidobacteria bacterium]|nr:M56 family metallopeptidase [Acidobacteriota bacterium]